MSPRNFRRIFIGFFLIGLAVVSLVSAFYWPQMKQSFLSLSGHGNLDKGYAEAASTDAGQSTASIVSVEATNVKEGLLWFDPASSQYIVTLGKDHGVTLGKSMIVYDGVDELARVTVDQVLEKVSYARLAKSSVNMRQGLNRYYRVEMK